MKFTIGYNIFNKKHLIEKIVDGVARLKGVPSIFLFDGCTDYSLNEFLKHRHKLKNCRVFLNEGMDLFETCSNNFVFQKFETDYCIICQDDLIVKNREFIDLAEKIYVSDPSAGLVGFKDGYEMDVANVYRDFVSSPWSVSKHKDRLLAPGEYLPRTFVNRGPLCFPRNIISKVGYLDELFYPLFWDDNDYCLRCRKAGFRNYIAFSEIDTSLEWGATRTASKIPCKAIYVANQFNFARKWKMSDGGLPAAKVFWSTLVRWRMVIRHKIRNRRYQIRELRQQR